MGFREQEMILSQFCPLTPQHDPVQMWPDLLTGAYGGGAGFPLCGSTFAFHL